jgi:hypothetical protein
METPDACTVVQLLSLFNTKQSLTLQVLGPNQRDEEPSTPIVEICFSMFSSDVPSISHAFHDAEARVAARISLITPWLSASPSELECALPASAPIIDTCSCVGEV